MSRAVFYLFLAATLLIFGVSPGLAEKRVAMVVGNGAYINAPALDNPANDAALIAESLTALGFEVTKVVDGDHRQMLDAMSAFGRSATGADVALFFYAGHGVQVGGRNWLLPVSSSIKAETDLPSQAIRTNDIMEVMEASGASLKLVLLDACRNNPLPKTASRGATRGLARLEARTAGTMISFATAPGDVAADGTGNNSPFTTALAQHIATPGLEIRQLMGRVREMVYKSTDKAQLPWVNEALIGEFYFAGKDPNAQPIPVAEPKAIVAVQPKAEGPTEKEAFAMAQSINNKAAWDAFLGQFPGGAYAAFATAARDKLSAPAANQTAAVDNTPPAAAPPSADRSVGFIFPDSGSRRIAQRELDALSKGDLRIARNEIFARRGRYFKSTDLKQYFSQFPWYQPHTWQPKINSIEKANVKLIKKVESWR